jgi:hypothetical protein
MQGTWTVSVKQKSAAWPQRFIIQGSDSADGVYAGVAGNPPVLVSGDQWTIMVEHNPVGPAPWTASTEHLTTPSHTGSQIVFDIRSNDSGPDVDFNDLVLKCATPASPFDYVVYGRARSYSGFCKFNPCSPKGWLVIDSPIRLKDVLNFKPARAVLERLYPERVKEALDGRRVAAASALDRTRAVFRPLMIPMGDFPEEARAGLVTVGAVHPTTVAAMRAAAGESPPGNGGNGGSAPKTKVAARKRAGNPHPHAEVEATPMATAVLDRPAGPTLGGAMITELSDAIRDLGRLGDLISPSCSVQDASGLLLRFVEYDRSSEEMAGGPYTGSGHRTILGQTVTDELGNYLFHFTQSIAEVADEVSDIAPGEAVATQLRPDVILQVITGGATVLYESGLFSNIPNLKKIDLCLPEDVLDPGPPGCQGVRPIQAIGNVFTVPGTGNTLDADGRITATHPSGPQITRGAWVGVLDMFACFHDASPPVTRYAIRYRRPGGAWAFVEEPYSHVFIPFLGDPSAPEHKVGPFYDTPVEVGGGPAVTVATYKNIESDPNWLAAHRMRKVQLRSWLYENLLYDPDESPRTVEFRIEGYDGTGDMVAWDSIKLSIDNRPIQVDVAEISMDGLSPGECGLFELTSPNAPLTARFRVHHPGGFAQSYGLGVTRGSSTGVPVSDNTAPVQPLSLTYSEPTHGNFFFGTLNAVGPDGAGYVEADLQANAGAWLPPGHNFCAFAFSVSAGRRVTNGYGTEGATGYDTELVGISYAAP